MMFNLPIGKFAGKKHPIPAQRVLQCQLFFLLLRVVTIIDVVFCTLFDGFPVRAVA